MTFFIISHCSKQVWEMEHFGSNHFHLRIHHLFSPGMIVVIIIYSFFISYKKLGYKCLHWISLPARGCWMLMCGMMAVVGFSSLIPRHPPPSIVPHSSAWRWRGATLAEIIKNGFHIIHIENCKILQVTAIIMYNVRYDSHLKLIYYQNVREKLLSNSSDIGNCFLLPNEATFKQISSNFPTSIITSTEFG